MPDTKISACPSATTPLTGTETVPLLQGGANDKTTSQAVADLARIVVNAQTGTSYTIAAGDRGKLVTLTNAAAIAVTLPQAGATFPSGWYVYLEDRGAGTVTITPTTSTIDGAATLAVTTNQGVLIASDGTNYFTVRGMDFSLAAVHAFTKNQNVVEVALTDGATVNTDASLSNNFRLVIGGNRTLANPTNMTSGMVLNFVIKQDGTGSRTLAYGSKFKWESGTAPVLSTAAAAIDFISAYYNATDDILIGAFVKGLA